MRGGRAKARPRRSTSTFATDMGAWRSTSGSGTSGSRRHAKRAAIGDHPDPELVRQLILQQRIDEFGRIVHPGHISDQRGRFCGSGCRHRRRICLRDRRRGRARFALIRRRRRGRLAGSGQVLGARLNCGGDPGRADHDRRSLRVQPNNLFQPGFRADEQLGVGYPVFRRPKGGPAAATRRQSAATVRRVCTIPILSWAATCRASASERTRVWAVSCNATKWAATIVTARPQNATPTGTIPRSVRKVLSVLVRTVSGYCSNLVQHSPSSADYSVSTTFPNCSFRSILSCAARMSASG